MDKTEAALLILLIYLVSVFAVGLIITHTTETEFCKQNGFEEYTWERQDLCRKKNFEENELVFENKKIYCERDPLKVFYYQEITTKCYLLKETK